MCNLLLACEQTLKAISLDKYEYKRRGSQGKCPECSNATDILYSSRDIGGRCPDCYLDVVNKIEERKIQNAPFEDNVTKDQAQEAVRSLKE